MSSGRDEMMQTWSEHYIESNVNQSDDAIEFYMKRCSQLESENIELKEELKRLKWSVLEHD
jgi:prefoldin subunit 5